MIKTIFSWKPISRTPLRRPKTRWVDDVRKDIQKLKVPNWKTLAQDRRRWKELVEKAKTLSHIRRRIAGFLSDYLQTPAQHLKLDHGHNFTHISYELLIIKQGQKGLVRTENTFLQPTTNTQLQDRHFSR